MLLGKVIDINIKFEDYQKLAHKRQEALILDRLLPSKNDWVPAEIKHNDNINTDCGVDSLFPPRVHCGSGRRAEQNKKKRRKTAGCRKRAERRSGC